MTAEDGFGVDKTKASGRRSYRRECDRRRGRAYYNGHKDELYAQREAAREAPWQAELEVLAVDHKKRVAAAKKLHAAQVRRQKEFLRSVQPEPLGLRLSRSSSAGIRAGGRGHGGRRYPRLHQ